MDKTGKVFVNTDSLSPLPWGLVEYGLDANLMLSLGVRKKCTDLWKSKALDFCPGIETFCLENWLETVGVFRSALSTSSVAWSVTIFAFKSPSLTLKTCYSKSQALFRWSFPMFVSLAIGKLMICHLSSTEAGKMSMRHSTRLLSRLLNLRLGIWCQRSSPPSGY